ncbi:MAG: 2-phospho-L-lactate guanylyltransferase [Thermomicrobiales bacterium]
MNATAVIPVKGLRDVKRRLSSRLSSAERAGLVMRLVGRELDVLGAVERIERVIVVTSDERVKTLAEMKHADVALQPDNGVNAAIDAGIARAYEAGAQIVVALHGDLPFIVKSDVEALLDATGAGVFVIAPDRKRIGTNAIVVRRADPVPLRFGFDSYARHLDAATSAGTLVREVRRSGLGFDLDTPGDLIQYRRRRKLRDTDRQIRQGNRIAGNAAR